MQITIKEGFITNSELIVEHDGENITFNASPYGSGTFKKFDVFEHFNAFMKTRSLDFQKKCFTNLIEIRTVLDSFYESNKLSTELIPRVTSLVDMFNIEEVVDWVNFKSDIRLPPHFATTFVEDINKGTTREQTYLKSDYVNLISISIILRVMVPVWSEFIARVRQDTGTMLKEYVSGQLVSKTKLYNSEIVDKLREYIVVCVANNHLNNPSLILGGVSSEDFLDWITALVLIRRLAVGDVRGIDPKINLITSVYSYITQRVSPDNPASSEYREKSMTVTSESDMDAKLSVLERYKIKHDISLGEIVELEHSVSDIMHVAKRLEPNIPEQLVINALNTSKVLLTKQLLDPQINILKWLLSGIISPRGLLHLQKEVIVNLLAVAQAVLYYRGHTFLAMAITTHVDMTNEVMLLGVDSRARIPKEILAELDKYFPFVRKSSNRSKNKVPNLAHQAIDKLVEDLSMFNWVMTADKNLVLELSGGKQHSNRLIIPHDIKIKVANFVLDVVKRKSPTYQIS